MYLGVVGEARDVGAAVAILDAMKA